MGQAAELVERDHKLVWFYIPERARWENISRRTTGLGKYLLGRAYEYLLRKFAEGQGQSAGEFYTPARPSC